MTSGPDSGPNGAPSANSGPLEAPGANPGPTGAESAEAAAQRYYDTNDAQLFYTALWGGEDLHVGYYEDGTDDVAAASTAIVDLMASMAPQLAPGARVMDLGAGFGGSMRRLARAHSVSALCLNISALQNARNAALTREAGLAASVFVVHGSFTRTPGASGAFDVVWSQDAILHADDQDAVYAEAARLLRPGGLFILTDLLGAEGASPEAVREISERLLIEGFASEPQQRARAEAAGLSPLPFVPLTPHLARHYREIGARLAASRDALGAAGASTPYLSRMLKGMNDWVEAAEAERVVWGVQRYLK